MLRLKDRVGSTSGPRRRRVTDAWILDEIFLLTNVYLLFIVYCMYLPIPLAIGGSFRSDPISTGGWLPFARLCQHTWDSQPATGFITRVAITLFPPQRALSVLHTLCLLIPTQRTSHPELTRGALCCLFCRKQKSLGMEQCSTTILTNVSFLK